MNRQQILYLSIGVLLIFAFIMMYTLQSIRTQSPTLCLNRDCKNQNAQPKGTCAPGGVCRS
jgi:hypothetical protein